MISSDEEEEIDIYQLEKFVQETSCPKKLTSDLKVANAKIEELEKELTRDKQMIAAVQKENEILRDNITKLYDTAKLELSRKSKEIEDLRNKPVYPSGRRTSTSSRSTRSTTSTTSTSRTKSHSSRHQ